MSEENQPEPVAMSEENLPEPVAPESDQDMMSVSVIPAAPDCSYPVDLDEDET